MSDHVTTPRVLQGHLADRRPYGADSRPLLDDMRAAALLQRRRDFKLSIQRIAERAWVEHDRRPGRSQSIRNKRTA